MLGKWQQRSARPRHDHRPTAPDRRSGDRQRRGDHRPRQPHVRPSTTGAVECWGDNYYGQVGDGTTSNATARPRSTWCPTASPGSTPATTTRAPAGSARRCAGVTTSTDRSVTAARPRTSPVTVLVVGGGVVQAGDSHTCILNAGAVVLGPEPREPARQPDPVQLVDAGRCHRHHRRNRHRRRQRPHLCRPRRPDGQVLGQATIRVSSASRRTSRRPCRSSVRRASCRRSRSRWCRLDCWTPGPVARPSTDNTPAKDNALPAPPLELQSPDAAASPPTPPPQPSTSPSPTPPHPASSPSTPATHPRPPPPASTTPPAHTIPNERHRQTRHHRHHLPLHPRHHPPHRRHHRLTTPPAPAYTPLVPARLLDTRPGSTTIDGQFAGNGQRPAGTTTRTTDRRTRRRPHRRRRRSHQRHRHRRHRTRLRHRLPLRHTHAHWPPASTTPPAPPSPTNVIAKLGTTGTICLYTLAPTHLIVDTTGWLPATPGYTPLVPARLLDTRPGSSTIDGQLAGNGQRPPAPPSNSHRRTRRHPHRRRRRQPSTSPSSTPPHPASSPSTPATHPCPLASSLNYTTGATIPNEVIAKLSTTGTICLYTLAPTHLIVDTTGWIA